MTNSTIFWIGFHLFVLAMIYLDLKVFHKNPKKSSLKKISLCCLFWISLALLFNALVGMTFGMEAAFTFFTAYLLEASLSIDNLFLILVIFSFCHIQEKYQHRVLYLGILGALVFRLSFIILGISILSRFEWMYFIFGAFLCGSALLFFRQKEEKEDLKNSLLVRFANKVFPVDHGDHGGHFFIRKKGKLYVTMLFLSLFLVEVSDVIFAIDSVPAVLAITSDLFIAYTSNVFAVLGLRSFYFLLKHLKEEFSHLKTAIAVILLFVGCKLILVPFLKIPSWATLSFIAGTLLVSIFYSFKVKRKA